MSIRIWTFGAVIGVLLAACSSQAPDLTLGSTATVATNNLSCYRRPSDLHAAMTALIAKDKIGFDEATRGKAIFLQKGQHVRVVDQGGFMGAADRRIRIESGTMGGGQACWLNAEDVQYFRDVKQ